MKRNFTVRQGALEGIEVFLSVAQHRSFRRAAAELGVTPSAVSQAVRALENRVGTVLFTRTTRSVGLTEAGELFLARAKPAFQEIVAAGEIARELGGRPSGTLRLSAPRAAIPILLQPLITSFREAYPEVEVEVVANEKLVDLAAEGFDAVIRFGQFVAADMVAIRLTPPFRFAIVASPAYLARTSVPETPEDLRNHACLRLRRSGGEVAPWALHDNGQDLEIAVSGPLLANDYVTLLGAAIDGMGLVQVPGPVAAEALRTGQLTSVLERFAPMTPGMFLCHPGRHQVMPKLRAFIEHIKRRAARNPDSR
ncbi:MAG TPA: LysR family transcriptional regulator [Steroidobacteraceae bacterium]|jgi:DNA-binding transcriptional LysR family regulator